MHAMFDKVLRRLRGDSINGSGQTANVSSNKLLLEPQESSTKRRSWRVLLFGSPGSAPPSTKPAPLAMVENEEIRMGPEEINKKIDSWALALEKSETISDLENEPLDDFLVIMQRRFGDFRAENESIRKKVVPVFNILHRLVGAAGEAGAASGAEFGSKAIAGALALLFDAARSVTTAYDGLETLFSQLNDFLVRRRIYGGSTSANLQKIIDEILHQTVDTLILSSRMIQEGRTVQYFRYFPRRDNDYQKALKRLDELTCQESGVILAETHQGVRTLLERSENTAPDDSYTLKPHLPAKPIRLVGRDEELESIKHTLLHGPPSRVAILGLGGIGKTSVALYAMHDSDIASRYPNRFFVSCEGVTSQAFLLKEIADVLQIQQSERTTDIFGKIKAKLSDGPSLLCLDNFETPWEEPDRRPQIEMCISQLAELDSLALLITMRGAQHPAQSKIAWSEPILLRTLDNQHSTQLYKDIASSEPDEYALNLLDAVDGIPLAITLLAHLVKDDSESAETIWTRWCREHTSVIENGGDDRLSQLNISISLSITSPRMSTSALQVLHMVALLPDGFSAVSDQLTALQELLPDVNLRREVLSLQRLALVEKSASSGVLRYKILEPIRRYTLDKVVVNESLQIALLHYYTHMMADHSEVSPESHAVVPPELSNLNSILTFGFLKCGDVDGIVQAAIYYTRWTMHLAIYSAHIICLALSHKPLPILQEADCLSCLGEVLYWQDRYDHAAKLYKNALRLYEEDSSVNGQANTHYNIGKLYMMQHKPVDAEESLREALKLHRETHSVLGQANAYSNLGHLQMQRGNLDAAEESFGKAISLHREVHNVLGQGYDHRNIGVLQMQREDLDAADESFREALRLHTEARSVYGQAADYRCISDLQMRRGKLDEAEESFREALRLPREARAVLGWAYVCHDGPIAYLPSVRVQTDGELFGADESFPRGLYKDYLTPDVKRLGRGSLRLPSPHLSPSSTQKT